MPRGMPKLANLFSDSSELAVSFAEAVENARSCLGVQDAQTHLPVSKLELAYELAYLRAFTAWEDFLEQSFLRYLCGYSARHGQEQLTSGHYYSNLSQAKVALYRRQNFLLWHNPGKVISRAQNFFSQSRHETVIASMQGRIEYYAAIRHRIAHAHGSTQFDSATMALAGRRYRGARPGRFLRDWVKHTPTPTRWIEAIVIDFRGLAFQIVPP